jgi:hypothetical protein
MECGSSLPLSARLLAGALWAGSKLPAQKAGASSRTPYRHDFHVPLVVTPHRPTNSLRKCTTAILATPCRLEAGATARTAGILPAWGRADGKPALHPKVIPSGRALLTLSA